MARSTEQKNYEEKYIKKMEKWQQAYKERTEFVSKFKLKPEKTKNYYGNIQVVGSTSGNGSAEKKEDGSASGAPAPGGGSEMGKKVAAAAEAFIGKCVYRWGGKDPTTGGADCSGFTHYVLKHTAGVEIGGDTIAQSKAGTLLEPKEKALPGDVIMFQGTYRAGPSHVGIVYEWPKFIHCGGAEGRDGVQWGSMEGTEHKASYWKTKFLSIRRVIADNGNASASEPKKEEKKEEPKPKAMALASPEESITETLSYSGDTSDDAGAEWMLLNGGTRTSTPGAPTGWFEYPAEWMETKVPYKPIQINQAGLWIRPTREDRAGFLHKRLQWARSTGYEHFQQLDPKKFIHLERHDGYEGNIYSPDARQAFELFYLKSKRDKIEVLSGFRFSPKDLISPHEAGMAMDIKVYGEKDARELADIAWSCGFRAIAMGGDIKKGTGFLHIDIGPKSQWGYDDIPMYIGPGR